jgi:cytochrome c heme-lyase
VYGQRIDLPQAPGPADPLAALRGTDVLDPKNNMPLAPNQQPCPGQRRLLSTERIESNIPKGGTSETWVYPSPQMFFNGGWAAQWRRCQLQRRARWFRTALRLGV